MSRRRWCTPGGGRPCQIALTFSPTPLCCSLFFLARLGTDLATLSCWAGSSSKLSSFTSRGQGWDAQCSSFGSITMPSSGKYYPIGWGSLYFVVGGESAMDTAYCYDPLYQCPWSATHATACGPVQPT